MGSYSGFLRKAPGHRLKSYLEANGLHVDDGFDWQSEGRGNAYLRSLDEAIGKLPPQEQDRLRAHLDLLAGLATPGGRLSAEQICAGEGIDIEGHEGVEDVLLRLAVDHSNIMDRIIVQASLMRNSGGRQWSHFQLDKDKAWQLESSEAREAFIGEAVKILDLPQHRKKETDWYEAVRRDFVTGEERVITHATLYVEDKAESELGFGASDTLERQLVQKVVEVGLACDPQTKMLEVFAKGGKRVRDKYAAAFQMAFAPGSDTPQEVERRNVSLDVFYEAPAFQLDPADGIEMVFVSALDFYHDRGGFSRHEKPKSSITIFDFLKSAYRERSPLDDTSWMLVAATLKLKLTPQEGSRGRTLTVTLRTPNTTSLPNMTDQEKQLVTKLLERWRLLPVAVDEAGV